MGHVALVARLGAGGCEHCGLGGGHSCHLLTQLAQLVAQEGHVISDSDGFGVHGEALGVDGVLALHAVILLEHGEDLKAHLVKVIAPIALVDLAGLYTQSASSRCAAKVSRRVVDSRLSLQWLADPSSSELSSRSFSTMVRAAASVADAMPSSARARSSEALVMRVSLSLTAC
eukprot:6180664-Pleurochrysis_carterae.AAC.4